MAFENHTTKSGWKKSLFWCIIGNMAKTYHIIVFGCQMNIADSERVEAALENTDYKKTLDINGADLIVVVMCSVRQSAVDRVHFLAHKLKKIHKENPKLKTLLTGCILKKDKKTFEKNFDYVIDIKDINRFFDSRQKSDYDDHLNIEPKYNSKTTAYVPIMTGCNNFCSYCVVPYTRGREISRPVKKIIAQTKKLVESGYKEIWLLGQNVNSYHGTWNIKHGTKQVGFADLLEMIDKIPGKFELNFLTSHPKDFSDELIKTMVKCIKLSKRLNLPIQSGDDKILKKMNRPYTVLQYKNLVKKIRKSIPDISLSTDVIVGFPGETKKQFENTVKAFKQIGFDMAFVNKYSPRPGTAAAKLKDNISWAEKKRREKILINLVNAK